MKRILIILSIFLVLIGALGIASAAEDVDMDGFVSNSTDLEQDDCLGDAAPEENTFSDVQTQINQANVNDVVELEGTYCGNGTPITIDKSLTLKGKGEGATLDARGLSSVMTVTASNVTIHNIKFVNGYGKNNGAAVDWNANYGAILNSTFENNTAQKSGGAVYWTGNTLNITDCQFRNCTSRSIEDSKYLGGILYIHGSNVNIAGSTFDGDGKLRECMGGAIFLNASNSIIEDSHFSNFYTTGAIIYISDSNRTEIRNSKFSNYSVKQGFDGLWGAIVHMDSDNLLVSGCEFKNTSASLQGSGGGIYVHNTDAIEIINCRFIETVACDGGGIYLWKASNVNIEGCEFTNNTIYQAAIYVGSCNNTNIAGCNYSGIISDHAGGVIICNSPYTVISDNVFNDMPAELYEPVISSRYSDIENTGSKIINCTFSRGTNAIDVESDFEVIKKYRAEILVDTMTCQYGHIDPFVIRVVDASTGEPLKNMAIQTYFDEVYSYTYYTNESGEVSLSYIWDEVGLRNFTVDLLNNGNYGATKKTITINVTPANTTATVEILGSNSHIIGGTLQVTVRIDSGDIRFSNEIVELYVDDEWIVNLTINSNYARSSPLSVGALGNHTIKAVYRGNKNLKPSMGFADYEVVKEKTILSWQMYSDSFSVDDNGTFGVFVSPSYVDEGIIRYFVDDEELGYCNASEKFSINIPHAGKHNLTVLYTGSDIYADSIIEREVTVRKGTPNISISSVVFNKTDDKKIKVFLTSNRGPLANYEIKIKVNNNDSLVFLGITDSEGIANVDVNALQSGEYFYTAGIYNNSDYYDTYTYPGQLIIKQSTSVEFNSSLEFGRDVSSDIRVKVIPEIGEVNEGMVSFYVDGAQIGTGNVENGFATVSHVFESCGKFNVTAVYHNSTRFDDSNVTVQAVVKFATRIVSKDLVFNKNDEKVVRYNLTDNEGVELSKDVKISIWNSKGESVNIGDLMSGEYTFNVAFEGDDLYASSQSETHKILIRTPTQVKINGSKEILLFEMSEFVFEVIPEEGNVSDGIVTFHVDGTELTSQKFRNSTPIFKYVFSKTGKHNVTIAFGKSEMFEDSNSTVKIDVLRIPTSLSTNDFVFDKKDNKTIAFNLSDINGNALDKAVEIIVINSQNQTVNISGLESGKYTFHVVFEGDENYTSCESVTGNITVRMPTSISIAEVSNPLTLKPIELGAVLLDELGNVIGGEMHYFIDGAEVVGNFTTLKTGKYELKVTFGANATHSASENVTTFEVGDGRPATAIEAGDVAVVYGDVKYLRAVLKTADGAALAKASVEVTLNGKTISFITNEKGEITVPVKLDPKNYPAKIEFKGNDYYKPAVKSVSVIVKKAPVKLTAKKKTFKSKVKTKKYTVVLKNNKNKPIAKAKLTLKVKGKTYKATTNSKGKATFKITKLTRKGTHNAVIKYKTTKFYNGASKTVKIKVKK